MSVERRGQEAGACWDGLPSILLERSRLLEPSRQKLRILLAQDARSLSFRHVDAASTRPHEHVARSVSACP
jgi:hypothetical protein